MIAESTCGTGYQLAPASRPWRPVRQYTWGLDLAGQGGGQSSTLPPDAGHGDPALRAAGGIGGLLAAHQAALDRPGTSNDVAAGDYGFTYDGNGNVVQVVNVSDYGVGNFHWQAVRTMAVYEYDAYGHVIGPDVNGDGQYTSADVSLFAAEQPFRFSTKYFDLETGLGSWGYRYYNPALGRWVSRDPMEELGGVNLYIYASNDPGGYLDPYGENAIAGCLVGALVGGGVRAAKCWWSGESNCLCKAGCAAASGCIVGAIVAQFPSAQAACLGAVLGALAEAACNVLVCGDAMDICTVLDATIGAGLGCVAGTSAGWKEAGDKIRSAIAGGLPGVFAGCAEDFSEAVSDTPCK